MKEIRLDFDREREREREREDLTGMITLLKLCKYSKNVASLHNSKTRMNIERKFITNEMNAEVSNHFPLLISMESNP